MHRVTPTIAQNSCKICPVANYATTAAWTDLVCHRILALGLACILLCASGSLYALPPIPDIGSLISFSICLFNKAYPSSFASVELVFPWT